MKTKFYFFIFLFSLLYTAKVSAQCEVTITSIYVNGNMVTVTASGVGNANPAYVWDWDDSTASSYGTPAYHTYSVYKGYQICVTYVDSANPFNCIAADCDSVYIVPTAGVNNKEQVKADIKVTPNPFAETAYITVSLSQGSNVHIEVYDLTGNKVEDVYNERLQAGTHILTWKPQGLSEGIYFLQLTAGNQFTTHKIIHSGEK